MEDRSLVYLSTGLFKDNHLDSIIENCRKHSFNQIELSSGVKPSKNYRKIIDPLKDTCNMLVHNYFPPPETPFVLNLASTDRETLNLSIAHCKRAIELCRDLNAPFYSVHAGFSVNLTPDLLGNPEKQVKLDQSHLISRETAYEVFLDSIGLLNKYAKENSIGLLVENNVVTPRHVAGGRGEMLLMVRAGELIKLMRDVSSENLKVLLDVGHLNVSSTALGYSREEFFLEVKDYIGAYHLSENNGLEDQNLPVTENSWFWSHMPQPIEVPVVLEAYRLSQESISRQKVLVEDLVRQRTV